MCFCPRLPQARRRLARSVELLRELKVPAWRLRDIVAAEATTMAPPPSSAENRAMGPSWATMSKAPGGRQQGCRCDRPGCGDATGGGARPAKRKAAEEVVVPVAAPSSKPPPQSMRRTYASKLLQDMASDDAHRLPAALFPPLYAAQTASGLFSRETRLGGE